MADAEKPSEQLLKAVEQGTRAEAERLEQQLKEEEDRVAAQAAELDSKMQHVAFLRQRISELRSRHTGDIVVRSSASTMARQTSAPPTEQDQEQAEPENKPDR